MTPHENRETAETLAATPGDHGATAFCAPVDETDERSVGVRVAEAVADALDCEIDAMAPLYDVVDPDALDDLLSASCGSEVTLTFAYEGCRVTVTTPGEILVRRLA